LKIEELDKLLTGGDLMDKKLDFKKNKMEVAKEMAEIQSKRVLEKVDAFAMNEHRKDPKGVPPVQRNDLGIGTK